MIAAAKEKTGRQCNRDMRKHARDAPIVFRNMLDDKDAGKTKKSAERQTKILVVGRDKEYLESLAGAINDIYDGEIVHMCSCEDVRGKYDPRVYTHVLIEAEEYDERAMKARDTVFSMDPGGMTKVVMIRPKEKQDDRHKVSYLEHQAKVKDLISVLSKRPDEGTGEIIEISGSKQLDDVFNEIYKLYEAKRPESIDVHIQCGGSYFLPAEYKIRGRTRK